MTDSHSALAVAPIGAWDRLAIVALGAAGCALSYDALQQMAVAIHVRGFLTYLFPLVIDGFIAYGVRALLVLAEAPLRARLYVWMLFGTATSASIWANALHAVRLNQQTTHRGLQLGDTVVAILSTLAPLALAGAVHLYILITRHHPADRPRTAPSADQGTGVRLADRSAAEDARDVPADSGPNSQPADQKRSGPASDNAATAAGSRKSSHPIETQADGPAAYSPEADRAANREANLQSDLALALPVPEASDHRTASATDQLAGPTDRTATDQPTGPTDRTATDQPTGPTDRTATDQPTGPTDRTATDQPTGPTDDVVPLEVLVAAAREGALESGRTTRRVLGPHLRKKGLSISNERFPDLQAALHADPELSHIPRSRRSAR